MHKHACRVQENMH
ncbi:hypothetical protein Zm00014a_031066 [Zea mays]|uniref:Uncharacterized protein n=1 Tax=Zea mays TaxID=4577 RepID=A0A3L6E5X1_MAIZE|nr:hypothetical protein Zm00014a_031066 [Zea mays]